MCGSMADIQSATAEIRRGKKEDRKKEEDRQNKPQGKNIMAWPIPQGGRNNNLICTAPECLVTAQALIKNQLSWFLVRQRSTNKITRHRNHVSMIGTTEVPPRERLLTNSIFRADIQRFNQNRNCHWSLLLNADTVYSFQRSRSRSLYAVARPSVCLSSVVCRLSNARAPYSGGLNFRQHFYSIWNIGHLSISTNNFTEVVPGEPLRRGS